MADPRPPAPYPPMALPIGSRVGEFEVRRVLGVGGFGIVYLAFDHLLEREVALKEYMPSSLAERKDTLVVTLTSLDNSETFALGLRSFVNEAKLLARFDHPSLVKVHRFWEANGTAYMAMALYKGRTVRDVRMEMRHLPDEAWVRRILEPLLGAVEKLHSEAVYHRDIAPDNILIEADGRPVLLDFGAARRVISDRSQALTAILKPSYAPIEQYADVTGMKQGAWTDVYALGATMHFLLLGKPPPPAPGRSIRDTMTPLASQNLPGCSRAFLELIDWMLVPAPKERPQSIAAVRDVLEGRALPPTSAAAAAPDVELDLEQTLPLGVTRNAGPDASTMVIPRNPTRLPPGSDEATVLMPRGSTGYQSPTRAAPAPSPAGPTAMPPAPPRPPVADEDATVVTSYQTGYRSQHQPPAPPQPTRAMPPSAPAPPQFTEVQVRRPQAQTAQPAAAVSSARSAGGNPLVPVIAGILVAVLLGLGLWWFLTRPVAVPVATPSEPAAPTSVQTPAPLQSPSGSPTATAAPGVATPVESQPQPSVAVPTAQPQRPATVQPRPVDTRPAQAPAATRPPESSQVPAPAMTPPAAATGGAAAPAPAQATAPTQATTTPSPAPTAASEPGRPTSPSERCAKELPLVRLICIELACNRSEFSKHPECLKLRAEQAGRRSDEGSN